MQLQPTDMSNIRVYLQCSSTLCSFILSDTNAVNWTRFCQLLTFTNTDCVDFYPVSNEFLTQSVLFYSHLFCVLYFENREPSSSNAVIKFSTSFCIPVHNEPASSLTHERCGSLYPGWILYFITSIRQCASGTFKSFIQDALQSA